MLLVLQISFFFIQATTLRIKIPLNAWQEGILLVSLTVNIKNLVIYSKEINYLIMSTKETVQNLSQEQCEILYDAATRGSHYNS